MSKFRSNIFVCYSRDDFEWMEIIESCLEELKNDGYVNVFIDKELDTGDVWRKRILGALRKTDIAIVLLSPSSIRSEFIVNVELPKIRRIARNTAATIIPLVIAEDDFSSQDWLFEFQTPLKENTSFSNLNKREIELFLDSLKDRIRDICDGDGISRKIYRKWIGNWRFSVPSFSCAFLVVLTAAIYLWWQIQPSEIRSITSSFPLSRCRAENQGSIVQLFEGGWLVARFETDEFFAIEKVGGAEASWSSTNAAEFTKGVPIDCSGVPGERLLRLGFRWWYCSDSSDEMRSALGQPLSDEIRVWLQYQDWLEGTLIYGLPSTLQGIEQGQFQILTGAVLNNRNQDKGSAQIFAYSTGNPLESVYCTGIWHPARQDKSRHSMHQSFVDTGQCRRIVDVDSYLNPSLSCTVSGY